MPRPALSACAAAVLLAHAALAWTCMTRAGARAPRAPVARVPVFVLDASVRPTAAPLVDLAARAVAQPVPGRPAPARAAPASAPARTQAPEGAAAPAGAPPPEDARPGDDVQPRDPDLALERFVPPARLDRPALPRSAPDIGLLQGLNWSGRPVLLRLYVDAAGTVVDVRVLQAGEDPAVVDGLRRMFLATGFVPGRAGGADVPSYRDIELDLASLPG